MSGDLVQLSNRIYLFDERGKEHLIEWFNELTVRYQIIHNRVVYVEFDSDSLAMEFKLRF
jgi:uncharacterized protein YrzB (UPF0473 family)